MLAPAEREPFWSEFRDAMAAFGYVEGRTARIEFRSGEGRPQLLAERAKDLARLNVDVIVAHQTPAVTAAKQATSRIPIVIASAADPVATGLVSSLARPGGNITGNAGVLASTAPKVFELLKELLPGLNRVVVLGNGVDPYTKHYLPQMLSAGKTLAIETFAATLHSAEDYAAAFADAAQRRVQAVIVQPSLQRRPAIELAAKHRLPTVSPARAFAEEGGLMSYSPALRELFAGAADYVDRILKGAKPADLPVQQPKKYELLVNARAAKALGLVVPSSILLRADKVIE